MGKINRGRRRESVPGSYFEWSKMAQETDRKSGKDDWKRVDADSRYDYKRIRFRLEALRHARAARDGRELLFVLNEGVHGNMGGIATPSLYREASFGTKDLITEYMTELESAINHVAKVDDGVVSFEDRLDFFRRASHCYGRSALTLSGAGSLTPFHCGVVSALHEQGLLPDVVSGSSGGAIVASIVGTRPSHELDNLLTSDAIADLASPGNDDDPAPGDHVATDAQIRKIEKVIPDMTFEEAFDVSGRYINISVAPAGSAHQKSRLLNAITSPHVYVREAVRASCAVPGVHPPCTLAAKDFDGQRKTYLPDHKWIDGAISDDLPRRGLSRLYGVNHTIASQTNPAVLWALHVSNKFNGPARAFFDWGTDLWRINVRAAHGLTRQLTDRLGGRSQLSHILFSVALQEYSADVTIMPSKIFYDPRRLLSENSRSQTIELFKSGERAAWPEIERIRNSTRVSRRLSEILKEYESRETGKRHHPLSTVEGAGTRGPRI